MDIFREFAQQILFEYLPEPHGSLLAGILLGIKSSLSTQFYNDLIKTGTVHIVAASGFNITIVAKVVIETTSKIANRKYALVFSFIFIWIYAWIAGFSAAVTRAALMGTIAFTAQLVGRKYLPTWSLIVSGVVMVLFDPEVIKNVGFWLSVSATAGILWLTDDNYTGGTLSFEKNLIKKGFASKPETHQLVFSSVLEEVVSTIKLMLWSDFKTTLAAQIATFPILFVVFGYIPILSVFINLMILWLIPVVMFMGVFKLFMGIVSGIVNKVMGNLLFSVLDFIVLIIQMGAKMPFVGYDASQLMSQLHLFDKVIVCFVWYIGIFLLVSHFKTSSDDSV